MKSCKINHIGNKLWTCFGLLSLIASVSYFAWSINTFSRYKNELTHQSNETHLVGDAIVKKDGACGENNESIILDSMSFNSILVFMLNFLEALHIADLILVIAIVVRFFHRLHQVSLSTNFSEIF